MSQHSLDHRVSDKTVTFWISAKMMTGVNDTVSWCWKSKMMGCLNQWRGRRILGDWSDDAKRKIGGRWLMIWAIDVLKKRAQGACDKQQGIGFQVVNVHCIPFRMELYGKTEHYGKTGLSAWNFMERQDFFQGFLRLVYIYKDLINESSGWWWLTDELITAIEWLLVIQYFYFKVLVHTTELGIVAICK